MLKISHLLIAGVFAPTLLCSEPIKIIAPPTTYVDPYTFRSDEVLCSGIAKEAGKAYLPQATTQEPAEYCKTKIKPKLSYPASSCNLKRMVKQCVDEIDKYKTSTKEQKR
jgi:hypothetical protein